MIGGRKFLATASLQELAKPDPPALKIGPIRKVLGALRASPSHA
jgi:hypothetical protein